VGTRNDGATSAGGPVLVREVIKLGAKRGIKRRMIFVARARLPIHATPRQGFGRAGWWELDKRVTLPPCGHNPPRERFCVECGTERELARAFACLLQSRV
jgi:hypothetical protein